jgi:MerR family copper efflux transcriptional regulator
MQEAMKNHAESTAEPVRIGVLAKLTGCSVPTIRYYEEVGLLPRATRRASGHRVYDSAAVQALSFVRRCRDFGFTIEQTRDLLSLVGDKGRDCVEARDIAQAQLKTVRAKVLELMDLERSLARFVTSCDTGCVGGPAPKCAIFKDLGSSVEATQRQSGCG